MHFLSLSVIALCSAHWSQADLTVIANDTINQPDSPQVSQQCVDALSANVPCYPYLSSLSSADQYGPFDDDLHSKICDPQCGSALADYHGKVESACVDQPPAWNGVPYSYFGDKIWATYNLTCLSDPSSGQPCQAYIEDLKNSMDMTKDQSITSLPKEHKCSPCVISLGQTIQSTSFSSFDEGLAGDWQSVFSDCGVDHPVDVQPRLGTGQDLPRFTSNYTSSSECPSGSRYNVTEGDDCNKIALAHNVSYAGLVSLNSLMYDCSNLQCGRELCLPQTCTTYTISANDTCWSIADAAGTSVTQLRAWNSIISNTCDNLINGTTICVSLPGGQPWTGTTISGLGAAVATPNATMSSGGADASSAAPTAQPNSAGASPGPSDSAAPSLTSDVDPSGQSTSDIPSLSAPAATGAASGPDQPAPTWTSNGVTSQCQQWYTISSGDGCDKLQSQFNTDVKTLQGLNPDLKDDCSNLMLDIAYCVKGQPVGGS